MRRVRQMLEILDVLGELRAARGRVGALRLSLLKFLPEDGATIVLLLVDSLQFAEALLTCLNERR